MENLPLLVSPTTIPHFHLHQNSKTSTVPLCEDTLCTNAPHLTVEAVNHFLLGYQDNDVPQPSFNVLLAFAGVVVRGFRHSAGFHASVILDGAACRLGEHGDVHDVLGVLRVDPVVPTVLRVLMSWQKEE